MHDDFNGDGYPDVAVGARGHRRQGGGCGRRERSPRRPRRPVRRRAAAASCRRRAWSPRVCPAGPRVVETG
ncbi:hypothetical protein [Streptomyces sp. NBC_00057]|uniref:hypothetical protein n=1 Tax=Streptomyces sp. NBC_00057 TaxID=2975634 RepID=UPI00386D7023